jgi:hypothetical protein
MRRTKRSSRVNSSQCRSRYLLEPQFWHAFCTPARPPLRARLRCNKAPTGQNAPTGAAQFLGADASLLQPGAESQAAYIYINPNVQWSNYKKVLLKPVEFWDTPDNRVSG